jgi:N utilization substance protein A
MGLVNFFKKLLGLKPSINTPSAVAQLFERYVPEITSGVVHIMAIARDPGERAKVAVCANPEVDAVRLCVGDEGSRIARIVEELGGERVEIIRWHASPQVMIPNALQPAKIKDVILYPQLGRAVVVVLEDELALAVGRGGNNVRLASKLVGWDIELLTPEELEQAIQRAANWFRQIPGVTNDGVKAFIEAGMLTYEDLTCLEPAELAELAGVTEKQAEAITRFAAEAAERGAE